MYNLISASNERVVKILNLLSFNKEVSIYDVMEVNQCSERTVYSDIQRIINDNVKGFQLSLMNKYLFANFTSNNLIEDYTFSIVNNDIRIKLIYEILFYPFQDLTAYAIELDASTVHLNTCIKSINEFLSRYNCIIKSSDNGYYIHADNEVQFRVMMAEYINTSPDRLSEFTNIVFPDVMYSKFINVFEFDFSKGYMSTLERFSNMRTIQQFSVTSEELCEDDEFEYILHYFVKLLEVEKNKFEEINYKVSKFTREILSVTDEETIAKVSELFISTLLRHIISGYVYYIEVDRLSIYCRNFSERYSKVSKEIDREVSNILDGVFDVNIERFMDEVKFFTYINIPEVIIPTRKSVIVTSDLGKEHCNSLYKAFSSMFNDHEFTIISKEELTSLDISYLSQYSCITSNYKLKHKEVPIIYVSDFPTTHDYLSLHNILNVN